MLVSGGVAAQELTPIIEADGGLDPDASAPAAVEPETAADATAAPEVAESETREPAAAEPVARWFSSLGVGLRAGGCFLSQPTSGLEFRRGAALGFELDWGLLVIGPHRVVLAAGYLWLPPRPEEGPAAVRVESRLNRVDLAAGYDFTWRFLVVGVHVGLGLGVNRVRTAFGAPGWTVEDGEISFQEPEDPEVEERVGVDPGLLAGMSVGIELGELFGVPDFLEIRAKSDYVLRGARHEFTALGMIVIWPTAWIHVK